MASCKAQWLFHMTLWTHRVAESGFPQAKKKFYLPRAVLPSTCTLWGCVSQPTVPVLSKVKAWKAWQLLILVASVSSIVCHWIDFVYLLLELSSVFSFGKVGITILIAYSSSFNRLGLILMDKSSFHVLSVTEFVKVRLGSCLWRVS